MREPGVVSPWRTTVLAALAAPLTLAGATTAAWAIDTRGDHSVRRGVVVAGTDVGGKSETAVRSKLERVATSFATTAVVIAEGNHRISTTAGKIGLTVDIPGTAAAVLSTGRHDPGPLAPLRWAKALVSDRPVGVRLQLDRTVAAATIVRLEGPRIKPAIEPKLAVKDGQVATVPGVNGDGLNVDAVLDAIPTSVADPTSTIRIDGASHTARPTIGDSTIDALAARANEVTKGKVQVQAGSTRVTLSGTELRPGFAAVIGPGGPELTLDPSLVSRLLDAASPAATANPTGVTFTQANGQMTPVAGHDAVACCAPDAAQRIVAGLLAGQTTITVPATTLTTAQGVQWASTLGVRQIVGQFTTHHPAGQPRVKNIHRLADIVRGTLIPPGQTFSVNGFVGQRTVAKGFVVAPVIDEGQFSTDVGGGVSQFATTLFNAAFFAGLDIPDHKAHSIYISRYPFGREATLAYPSVDLKIRNNTPYGVVIWPTYTESSLTVQLWSSPFALGVQTAQNKSSGCGRITTTRTRTFVDGHSDQQTYVANYNCNPPKE